MTRSVEKTAAASVDAITAPSRNDAGHERGNTAFAATAAIAAVTTTPTVLNAAAGTITGRSARHGVEIPPSNRITASPAIPTVRARWTSENSIPPTPSEPSSMPSPRNTTSTGTPARPASVAAATAASSTAPTMRISVPGSIGLPVEWWSGR